MIHSATNQSQSSDPLLWERCANLRPRVREHVNVTVQSFRQQRWYVVHNKLTGRHMRLNSSAWAFFKRLDGQHTVEEVVEQVQRLSSASFSSDDALVLLAQMQQQDGLLSGIDPDAAVLASQWRTRQKRKRKLWLMAPLAIRLPMFDPDTVLDRIRHPVAPFYGVTALVMYILLLMVASLVAVGHWSELRSELGLLPTSPYYFLLMWLVYPVLKTVHEFSHAILVKRWGGEVHEMGITLLVFTPVPYVDASAAWSFSSRWRRIMVSAAGIVAELSIASVALLVWVIAEPGLLRDLAFAALVTGSVSTLAFNANPLLKFDGYYMLQDALEIPNLYSRSQRLLIWMIKRWLLRIRQLPSPALSLSESRWLFSFGVLSLAYRCVITLVIALWLVGKLLVVGVVLLCWILLQQYLLPVFRGITFLLRSTELEGQRISSAMTILGLASALLVVGLLVPFPHSSRAQGVVWVAEQGQVYAGNSGQVAAVLVEPGSLVVAGQPLLQLSQPQIDTTIAVLEARLSGLQLQQQSQRADPSQRGSIVDNDIAALTGELNFARKQQAALLIEAGSDGVFTVDGNTSLQGRYYQKGELIAHIVDPGQLVVRVAIAQRDIGSIRQGVVASRVRLAERFAEPLEANLSNETPSANTSLPSAALGSAGGGGIAIAAGDVDGIVAAEKVFHLELTLTESVTVAGLGERVYVTLEHRNRTLADRWITSARQMFLKHIPDYAG